MERGPVLLIAFYNKKALGVRYLEKSLTRSGYKVCVLFLKNFNSMKPEPISNKELLLIRDLVKNLRPKLIGLSVMSSLYLETVIAVNSCLRENFGIPVAWGGVYASMFPEKSLTYADFVLRGECEEAVVELAEAVLEHKTYHHIKNLAYKDPLGDSEGNTVINELRPLCEDLDELGYPIFSPDNKFYIDADRIGFGDPMTDSPVYELSASRGCPFACSYCASINLRRMYIGNGRYVRFRGVSSIISELEEALVYMKDLKAIHFWDEIFPDDKAWIEDFAAQYKSRIGLPFEIWGHPLKSQCHTISNLVDAGLYKVVMGIQSGSPRIRSEVFHRKETQDEILEAGRTLKKYRVPQIVYDFILRHPFETEEDIKQTYELCTELERPFELQLHGLNFFPGTDIINIAEINGISVTSISESGNGRPMKEIYKNYWGQHNNNAMMNYWYSLIYISQFRWGLPLSKFFYKAPTTRSTINIALLLPKLFHPAARIRYYYKKAVLLARALRIKGSITRTGRQTVQYNEGK